MPLTTHHLAFSIAERRCVECRSPAGAGMAQLGGRQADGCSNGAYRDRMQTLGDIRVNILAIVIGIFVVYGLFPACGRSGAGEGANSDDELG
jgi:hypothetical protein